MMTSSLASAMTVVVECSRRVVGADQQSLRHRRRQPDTGRISGPVLMMMLMIFITCETGYALFMLTRGQQIVADINETVIIDCQFQETTDDRFNLFDNPVYWSKMQLDERSQINMMVNLVEPFSQLDQGRLRVSFAGTSPNYTTTLLITHIVPEDTANYTCIVSGPHNVILASVTHLVQVRAGIRQLKLIHVVGDSEEDVERVLVSVTPNSRATSVGQLVVQAGDVIPVDCTAVGGSPPPSVVLQLGRRDITDLFTTSVERSLSGRLRGVRRLHYRTVKRHRGLTAAASDDGLPLRCLATVPGYGPLSAGVRLTVHYAPVITCADVTAASGDLNVIMSCSVSARPPVTSLYWTLGNETTATDVTLGSNYVTLVRDVASSNAQLESQLLIRYVTADSFRTFTIVAENEVSTTSTDVRLTTREIHPLPPQSEWPTSVKFGRHSSSRYQPAGPNGVALHRYVTSGDKTTPTDDMTSSTSSRHRRTVVTSCIELLLLVTSCHGLRR